MTSATPRHLTEAAVAAVQAAGLRATRARVAVVGALRAAPSPLGQSDIESRLAGVEIPRSTVYRVLAELTEAGVLNRFEFEEGFARYELADGDHHHHFICRSCGSVLDLDGLADLERHMGRAEAMLEGTHGLTIEGHRLDLFGLCERCSKASGGGSRAVR